MGKRFDKKKYQEHVLSYIAQTGYEKGCCEGIPVAYTTYRDYKKNHSEFAEKVEIAKQIFAGLSQNIDAKISLLQNLREEARKGAIAKVEDRDATGKLLGTKTFRNPSRQWVYEKFYPKSDFLEKSIVMVLGAQFKFLKSQDISKEHERIITRFLQSFQQESHLELIKRGINI